MKHAKIELEKVRAGLDVLVRKEINKEWDALSEDDFGSFSEDLKILAKKYTFYLDILNNQDIC